MAKFSAILALLSQYHSPSTEGGGLIPQIYPGEHQVSSVDRPPPLAALVPAQVNHLPGRGGVDTAVPGDQSETCIGSRDLPLPIRG